MVCPSGPASTRLVQHLGPAPVLFVRLSGFAHWSSHVDAPSPAKLVGPSGRALRVKPGFPTPLKRSTGSAPAQSVRPAGPALFRVPSAGPAWLPADSWVLVPGRVLPWRRGRRRGCGNAELGLPRPATAIRRTESSRSRRRMTPGRGR